MLFTSFSAPRPVIIISEVQARQVVLDVRDPTPTDTSQYLVRYKTDSGHSSWVEEKRNKTGQGGDDWITLHGVHPYTSYTVEVASYYRDEDIGPYSVNKHFTTKQAGLYIALYCWCYFPYKFQPLLCNLLLLILLQATGSMF